MNKFKAGQWWQCRDGRRALILGVARSGVLPVAFEAAQWSGVQTANADGIYLGLLGGALDLVEHLPDCTGWDWTPEPEYIPWTHETCPVGAVLTHTCGDRSTMIVCIDKYHCTLGDGTWMGHEHMLASEWRIDGKPCGTLVAK